MNVPAKLGWLLLGLGMVNSMVLAHPGHAHRKSLPKSDNQQLDSSARTWAASTGAFLERGTFVMAGNGLVQIRRDDDSLVSLPIALLHSEDQTWIERRMSVIRLLAEMNSLVPANSGHDLWPGSQKSDSKSAKGVRLLKLASDATATGGFDAELPQGALLIAQLGNRQETSNVARQQVPEIARGFEAFVTLKAIQTRWDDRYFYVESNGIPDHQLMVGIKAWQQQVPLPQKYVGDNAWQIPLHPVPAETPATAKNRFLRGAIAVAVNGIPIFNPLNNRGDDAYEFGELDEFGGHCGRADDYHYHIAPVHLEKTNGKGKPIAYALDGYPIYGYEEPDGSPVKNLDALNGHKGRQRKLSLPCDEEVSVSQRRILWSGDRAGWPG